MTVKIVTDSTSDIPHNIAESLGITVVPCNITFGTETFKDQVELSTEEFYDRLVRGSQLPVTSQPSPGDFVEVYERVGKDATGIVSIHVSGELSGTLNSAFQAKAQMDLDCSVELVDSQQASCGLGLIAITAAHAARDGASVGEVAEVAKGAVKRAETFLLLDTLEYVERGGRIGKAQALVGSLLRIKPMLILRDGVVHELGKARTFSKGVAKLQESAREFGPLELISVFYTTDPNIAHEIVNHLQDIVPAGIDPFVTRAGPTIGTHAGPGAVGIGLLKAG